MHALRGLIQGMAKLSGIMPPVQVRHQHHVQVSVLKQVIPTWFGRLSADERALLELPVDKGNGEIAEGTDIVKLAVDRYREQETLLEARGKILEVSEW
jgi:hypothetical protein